METLLCAGEEVPFEFCGFQCGEGVSRGDYVGAVRVGCCGEVGEEGEHFGRVAAGAEDDEESCWL